MRELAERRKADNNFPLRYETEFTHKKGTTYTDVQERIKSIVSTATGVEEERDT